MCIDFEGGVRRFYGNFAGCPVACDFARELAGGAWRRSPKSQNWAVFVSCWVENPL